MRLSATSLISPTTSSKSSSVPSRARPSSLRPRPSGSPARCPHGHVEAVLTMIRKLGLEELIASKPSPQRDLVIAMIAERLLFPSSKLAHTRHWHDTTLAEELDVAYATEDHLYEAMDWLLERQGAIEKKLARRHLGEGALVLYDVTSSYYEGKTCPLARFGHDRDGKTGCPIIVYGMLTDADGRPVAVQVYPGNTARPQDGPRSGRGPHEAVRPVASGAGRRSWHAHANSDRCAQETPGLGLDLGAAQRRRSAACWPRPSDQAGSGGRTPGGDQLSGIPRRTAGGLLQPPVGRAAAATSARSCWRPRRPNWRHWPRAWRGRRVRPRRRPRSA